MMLKKISYIALFTILTLISAKAKSLSSHRSLIHYSDDDKIVKNQVFSSVKRKNSSSQSLSWQVPADQKTPTEQPIFIVDESGHFAKVSMVK